MSIYPFLKEFHSGWAYLTLLMGVLFVLMVGYFAFSKKARTTGITKLSFFATLTFHIQLLLGIVLYFVGPHSNFGNLDISNKDARLLAMEHPLMMFTAVILITIANAKLKKTESVPMSSFILGLIVLAIVLYFIPWNVWLA